MLLSDHEGPWTGTNSFRLMPTDEPHVAPATAQVSHGAGGQLALLRYTWSHAEDGGQDGLLVLGPDEEEGRVVALWGDSWHQSPAARTFSGSVEDGVVSTELTYGGDWRWIIVVDASDPEMLRLRMDNVVPASASPDRAGAYWAMQLDLRRG